MISCNIFYSWQSDLPNSTNRGLIGQALENIAKDIRADNSITIEPVIDRDTLNVPGSPNIAETILQKIAQSQIFVADVSIINSRSRSRHTPNPNVLIELGYAIASHSTDRIILVLNTAFGRPEKLPFDLKMNRVITYHLTEDQQDKASIRKQLERSFNQAVRTILNDIEVEEARQKASVVQLSDQLQVAIEEARPNQELLTRKFMDNLIDRLTDLAPTYSDDVQPDETLIQAIERTSDLVIEFTKVAETIAAVSSLQSAKTLYKRFERLLKYYFNPKGFSGTFYYRDFDYYKFISHELFVTLFAFLVRDERWSIITDLLETELYIENPENGIAGLFSFEYISRDVKMLVYRKERLNLNRISIHADLLNERHTTGPISLVLPMSLFIEADYLLFLRSVLADGGKGDWCPWSALYIVSQPPQYLARIVQTKFALQLLPVLGVKDIETLRVRLAERKPDLRSVFGYSMRRDPLTWFDLKSIGSS